jgi:hypothetical protein
MTSALIEHLETKEGAVVADTSSAAGPAARFLTV